MKVISAGDSAADELAISRLKGVAHTFRVINEDSTVITKTAADYRLEGEQCDQIGRFITLWATFQSPWQQLFCTKCQHSLGNFCKLVKIFHFISKILFEQLF